MCSKNTTFPWVILHALVVCTEWMNECPGWHVLENAIKLDGFWLFSKCVQKTPRFRGLFYTHSWFSANGELHEVWWHRSSKRVQKTPRFPVFFKRMRCLAMTCHHWMSEWHVINGWVNECDEWIICHQSMTCDEWMNDMWWVSEMLMWYKYDIV